MFLLATSLNEIKKRGNNSNNRTTKEPKLRKTTELNVFKCSDSVLPRPLKQDTLPVIVRLSTELMQMICSKDLAIDLFILRI